MKPLEKLAVLALLTFAFCGCTRTSEVKAEQKIAVQEEVSAKGRERTSETVQVGPETITTTTEEWDWSRAPVANRSSASLGVPNPSPKAGDDAVYATGASGPYPAKDDLPPAPLLVKRTVVVDQRGPSVDTKTASTQTVATASLHEKQESTSDTKKSTKWGLPWWVWALGAVGVALGIVLVRKTLLGKAVAAAGAVAKEVL